MDFTSTNVLYALGLTIFAGLSTGIGSALAFFAKPSNTRFLAVALGFSAGVMIYVSLVEIFQKAKDSLITASDVTTGTWLTIAAFFGGIFLIAIIDKLVPNFENPHEPRSVDAVERIEPIDKDQSKRSLLRMGLFTALAISIHNFPEGLATFTGALTDPALGISIAIAIAIHNIPEGVAVSVPIYYATGNKKKAFFYSFLSGLTEPVGAIIGFGILYWFFSDLVFGILFAGVAGIMVFVSIDELLPAAREYGEHHYSIYGLILGMMIMAVSLGLFV
jgi:zinc transporter, ZIP family